MAYAPVIVAILGIILSMLKIIAIVKDIRADNKDRDTKINQVIQENYDLKAKINELLTQLDHIKRD